MILRNLFANLFGKAWTALVSILVVPLYIGFLGIEAYGVIGLALSIQAMLSLLDLGLSYAITREFSRRDERSVSARGDVLRTFELCYLGIAAAIFALLIGLAGILSEWVNPVGLDREGIGSALRWFAAVISLSWPMALYVGALNGLELQVSANVLSALAATFRAVGGVAVLALIRQDLIGLFAWQAVVSLLALLVARHLAWRGVASGGSGRGTFSLRVVREQARYAAGVTAILLALTALGQIDKIVVSRMLSLEAFGYYSLAATVSLMLGYLVAPATTAIFPKLIQLLQIGDEIALTRTYHSAAQLIGCLVIPVAAVVAIYAQPLLALWTGNPVLARETSETLTLLLIANALNLLVSLSYSLQAAAGRNKPVALLQVASAIVVLPVLIMAVDAYGKEGAALCWLGLFLAQFILGPRLMHRYLLRGEHGRWLAWDVVFPTAVCVAGELALAHWIGVWGGGSQILGWALTWFIGATAYLAASPSLRSVAIQRLAFAMGQARGRN